MSVVNQHHGAGFLVQDMEAHEILTPEDMNDEQRMMMASIREFGEKEIMPNLEEIEKRNIAVIRPLFKKAAELGICAIRPGLPRQLERLIVITVASYAIGAGGRCHFRRLRTMTLKAGRN